MRYHGPVLKAFEDAQKRDELTTDLKTLIARFDMARDSTMVVPSQYLQAVIVKC